ncbi:Acyl-CoA N-acyltransferase with RING/FYVE/PHD-type zinc finger domain [Euphorbia peplus]|nr:Acyl-CoA N-acyltransferase with RING/FYVE/PHD-type zinc finger domain [Euphorbia peplus]
MEEGGDVCVDIVKEDTSRGELKRDREILIEPEQFPSKKQAKEISNEDIKSEVSNPVVSPKENASVCQDITSHPTELATCNQVVSGEITSTCSGNSDTLSDEGEGITVNNDTRSDSSHIGTSSSVSTSHVVLEIPKNASTSGIRKITFKFSKRKEDYHNQTIASAGTGITEQCSFSDRNGYGDWVDPTTGSERYYCAPNMELKMSKKVVPNNFLSNVKKLLSTGILDGARVKYFSPERELDGVIEGGGYLCGCSLCAFSRVLTAYEFEQHAGAKTRHPNNHIFLENGKPICSIIQELKSAPFKSMDEVIKDVAGSAINDGCFQVWKASLHQRSGTVEPYRKCCSRLPYIPHSNGSCFEQGSEENCYASSSSFMYNSHPFRHQKYMETLEEQKRPLKRPISLMQQKKTNEGGTKKRDNDLHRLLFLPNGLPDGAELAYSVKGQKMLAGYKQGNGIFCSCCEREISPSQFEAHAGMAARRQPYRHIYISNGVSLHDVAIQLARGYSVTTGVSDDMCARCGDGGDLISCENCPQAFHAACLDLQCSPKGPWHCPNCKTFGHGGNLARPIVIRLSRVVKSPEYEVGGCAICRAHDFSTRDFDDRTVILCDQCEREFHVGCLRESGTCDLKGIPEGKWFCSNDCNQIYVALQNSVSGGVQMIPALQLNIISRKHAEKGLHIGGSTDDLQWRILMGKSRNNDDLSLLSGAAAIFRECFDPIVAKSGRDLIPVMVYGRNISGQEFGGMYCIVLLVKNVVVSAGLLRIFGRDVAELPLVATSREHQGKGYFQALFSCIERLLFNLNVVNLVLPAAEEAESIWTRRFGFTRMSEGEISKCAREVQLTIFKGTSMLQKAVPKIIE